MRRGCGRRLRAAEQLVVRLLLPRSGRRGRHGRSSRPTTRARVVRARMRMRGCCAWRGAGCGAVRCGAGSQLAELRRGRRPDSRIPRNVSASLSSAPNRTGAHKGTLPYDGSTPSCCLCSPRAPHAVHPAARTPRCPSPSTVTHIPAPAQRLDTLCDDARSISAWPTRARNRPRQARRNRLLYGLLPAAPLQCPRFSIGRTQPSFLDGSLCGAGAGSSLLRYCTRAAPRARPLQARIAGVRPSRSRRRLLLWSQKSDTTPFFAHRFPHLLYP